MPSHGQNTWRQRAAPVAQWLVGFAVTGGGAAWEARRLADARGTVASGWAAGIIAGVGLAVALQVLFAVPALARGLRPRSIGNRIIMIVFLLFVAIVVSMPPRQNPAHYVITSGIEVAEIAFASILFAESAVLVVLVPVVGLAALRNRRTGTSPPNSRPEG